MWIRSGRGVLAIALTATAATACVTDDDNSTDTAPNSAVDTTGTSTAAMGTARAASFIGWLLRWRQ
jgi:hypothetical protein